MNLAPPFLLNLNIIPSDFCTGCLTHFSQITLRTQVLSAIDPKSPGSYSFKSSTSVLDWKQFGDILNYSWQEFESPIRQQYHHQFLRCCLCLRRHLWCCSQILKISSLIAANQTAVEPQNQQLMRRLEELLYFLM